MSNKNEISFPFIVEIKKGANGEVVKTYKKLDGSIIQMYEMAPNHYVKYVVAPKDLTNEEWEFLLEQYYIRGRLLEEITNRIEGARTKQIIRHERD